MIRLEKKQLKLSKKNMIQDWLKDFEDNSPPQSLKVYTGKSRRQAQSDARNLLDRLSKYKTEVLRFAIDLPVLGSLCVVFERVPLLPWIDTKIGWKIVDEQTKSTVNWWVDYVWN